MIKSLLSVAVLALGLASSSHADAIRAEPVDADWWRDRHAALLKQAHTDKIDALFLGDSITNFWGGDGARVWAKNFAPLHAANFGIGGDKIGNVLWRIENGELDGLDPRVLVLLIGTNNLPDFTADEISSGHAELIAELRRRLPDTKLLVLAVFPRVDEWSIPFRAKIAPINETLRRMVEGHDMITYLDIGSVFLSPDGSIAKDVSYDGLHFTEKGYQLWTDAMLPTFRKLYDQAGRRGF